MNIVGEVELWRERTQHEQMPSNVAEARESCYTKLTSVVLDELVADMREGGDCRNIGVLLSLLALVGKVQSGVSRVVTSVAIREQIRFNSGNTIACAMLDRFYGEVIRIRSEWIKHAEEHGQMSRQAEEFFDGCLLSYVLLYLEEVLVMCRWRESKVDLVSELRHISNTLYGPPPVP
jgi:hypothetical protein